LISSITFADSSTPNTPSNTVIATINWIATTLSEDTTIYLGTSISYEEQVYIDFLITVRQVEPLSVGNIFSGNVSTTSVLEGLYVAPVISTYGGSAGETVGYNVTGIIPANTTSELLTIQLSGNGFDSFVDNIDVITVGDYSADGMEDYSTLVSNQGGINGSQAVTISYDAGAEGVYSTDNHNVNLNVTLGAGTLTWSQDDSTHPQSGDTLPHYVENINCSPVYTTIGAGENFGDGSWISASIINDNVVNVTTTPNTTAGGRYAAINVFSSLNTTTVPNDTLYISQPLGDYITLKAAFQIVDGSVGWVNTLLGFNWESGGQWGDNYPMTVNGQTINLPTIPQGGVGDMRLTISAGQGTPLGWPAWWSDDVASAEENSYLEIIYEGDQSNWITIQSLVDNNINSYPSNVFETRCDISANSSTSTRTATIKAMHPDTPDQATITITQEAGYNSLVDTAEFYYNASQDYTNYNVGTSIPDEGTLLS
jgi:hypothetical protein